MPAFAAATYLAFGRLHRVTTSDGIAGGGVVKEGIVIKRIHRTGGRIVELLEVVICHVLNLLWRTVVGECVVVAIILAKLRRGVVLLVLLLRSSVRRPVTHAFVV